MKAAVINGPLKMEIQERPIPTPGSGQALVKVKSVGICGSDVHGFLGLSGRRRQPGLVMGHEASGQVEEIGKDVLGLVKGDRVAIDPQVYCGYCFACKHGWQNLCDNMSVIGSSMRNFKDGAMCDYIVLSASQLYKIPDNLSFSQAAMLDPVSNALHVFNRAQTEIGDTIAVIGTGVIGLVLVQVAKLKGAGKVIAVDASEARLGLAKTFGADVLVNSNCQNTVEAIMSETEGRGADIVVEAVGLAATYKNAVNSVRKRGQVAALGFRDDEVLIPIQPLLFREITIIGNTGFVFEIGPFIDFVAGGKIDVEPIITHTFCLDNVQKAFETAADESSGAIKVMIEP
ncbi:MAG: galactitol-1-phosphate 5-dehydrogenase [Actinobacteria bacterium]|nr:galactitol-1-phosphate 5-dehydrogenase [Actinomycetota bacterium]